MHDLLRMENIHERSFWIIRNCLLLGFAVAGCSPALPAAPAGTTMAAPHTDTSIASALQEEKLAGAFAYASLGRAKVALVCDNTASCSRRRSPASTFKIPHALFALDHGVVKPDTVFPGVPNAEIVAWRSPLDLRGALAASSVPWFQEVAKQLGPSGEQDLLSGFDYGNRQIGSDLTHFWLGRSTDGLQISPAEQVRFLDRLYAKDLPLRDSNSVNVLLDVLPHENVDGRTIIGKTGWATAENLSVTLWYVGWVLPTQDREGSSFALVLDSPSIAGQLVPKAEQRKPIAFALLKKAGRL